VKAGALTARLAVLTVAAVALVGCGERDRNDRRDDLPDPTTTAQTAPSTGVPDESTTSSPALGDGDLDSEGSSTTISGAEPGRPQLDGEPTAEPSSWRSVAPPQPATSDGMGPRYSGRSW
jgi:hypothetical protein